MDDWLSLWGTMRFAVQLSRRIHARFGRFHVKQSSPVALEFLRDHIDRLARVGRLRSPPMKPNPVNGDISFSTNDYLHIRVPIVFEPTFGAGGSLLVTGRDFAHDKLERALADWFDTDGAIVFTSGYSSNCGTISALVEAGDLVISDAFNHASLVDGARLSKGDVVVVPHLDVDAISRTLRQKTARRSWIVVESYYSMDADTPDLVALRKICDELGAALLVDEAHAIGVFGPEGRGLCAERAVVPDVLLGGLGKALNCAGGFVVGCQHLVEWLWNRARTFVFSTGISPLIASVAAAHVRAARVGDDRRAILEQNTRALRDGLLLRGISPLGYGPIVPWVTGSSERTLRISDALRARGIFAPAIRPPTVPEGDARIRFTVTAGHSLQDIGRLLEAIDKL